MPEGYKRRMSRRSRTRSVVAFGRVGDAMRGAQSITNKGKIQPSTETDNTLDFTEWLDRTCGSPRGGDYPATFFAWARTFAHRLFAARAIFALPAADNTRFFTRVSSRFVESPRAFAAARTRFNWCCILPNCVSSFLSSRLIAARMSMNGVVSGFSFLSKRTKSKNSKACHCNTRDRVCLIGMHRAYIFTTS